MCISKYTLPKHNTNYIIHEDDIGTFGEMLNYMLQSHPFIVGTDWMGYS